MFDKVNFFCIFFYAYLNVWLLFESDSGLRDSRFSFFISFSSSLLVKSLTDIASSEIIIFLLEDYFGG